ncbi:hypothetical protein Y1Q_0013013 [Alligator mississippiensis]|uniref:Uncharacterized protein n=1 Tax=Alligator mississippiensis TaxID=8496 RepID=A0A151MTH2_ALLMI|nr:hypothetical protein Y1Q_0013013 [Alligator mississippiensis]
MIGRLLMAVANGQSQLAGARLSAGAADHPGENVLKCQGESYLSVGLLLASCFIPTALTWLYLLAAIS